MSCHVRNIFAVSFVIVKHFNFFYISLVLPVLSDYPFFESFISNSVHLSVKLTVIVYSSNKTPTHQYLLYK